MSSVDEAGVAAMSEDGVTVTRVTSDDGEAEDGALRDDQAKLDDAWNNRKRSRS